MACDKLIINGLLKVSAFVLCTVICSSCFFNNSIHTLWTDEHADIDYTTITFGDIDSRLCESFDGSTIKIDGRLCFMPDHTALYPPQGNHIYKPVWLAVDSISPELKVMLTQKHGSIVTITGTIDLKNTEQYFPFYCAIRNVSCICTDAE